MFTQGLGCTELQADIPHTPHHPPSSSAVKEAFTVGCLRLK